MDRAEWGEKACHFEFFRLLLFWRGLHYLKKGSFLCFYCLFSGSFGILDTKIISCCTLNIRLARLMRDNSGG